MNIVKELRIKAGLQQKEVALAIGVSNPTVSEWEHQKKDPSGERLNKLADLFNVSPETILGINLSSIVSKFPNAYPMPPQNHLPIYGAIKCGPGGLAMEELLGYAESVKDPATRSFRSVVFALRLCLSYCGFIRDVQKLPLVEFSVLWLVVKGRIRVRCLSTRR